MPGTWPPMRKEDLSGQRYIKLTISSRAPGRVRVAAPANGNIAPPGYYMLFILNAAGVPSIARWLQML